MQNGDKALSSIFLAGRAILVEMLITLEPHHLFYAMLHAYLCFSTGGGGQIQCMMGSADVLCEPDNARC